MDLLSALTSGTDKVYAAACGVLAFVVALAALALVPAGLLGFDIEGAAAALGPALVEIVKSRAQPGQVRGVEGTSCVSGKREKANAHICWCCGLGPNCRKGMPYPAPCPPLSASAERSSAPGYAWALDLLSVAHMLQVIPPVTVPASAVQLFLAGVAGVVTMALFAPALRFVRALWLQVGRGAGRARLRSLWRGADIWEG